MFLDVIDIQLLESLKQNSREKLTNLATQLNLTPSAVKYRIDRLVECGIIDKFTIQIDPKKVGYEISAYLVIYATSRIHINTIIDYLKNCSEVSKIAVLMGDPDLIIHLSVISMTNLAMLIKNLSQVEEIQKLKTWFVTEIVQPSNGALYDIKSQSSISETVLKKVRSDI